MDQLNYFGFTEDPFRLTPDRDFYFPSANHSALGEVIRYGLNQGEGFIIVTGEVGTGKTMILRFLMNELGAEFETALLLSPHLLPKELLLAILQDIGIGKGCTNQDSMDHLLRVLNEHLFILSQADKRLVIIIDEAQNLPEESIEQLRLLSNFESDKQKLLQIILVGQPELKKKIQLPSLRQLLQRITIMETLNPLSKNESAQYVHFRIQKAGRGDMQLNRGARNVLWRYTKGVPRLINKLMSRTLLIACAENKQLIDSGVLKEAAVSLELTPLTGVGLTARIGWLITATILFIMVAWILVDKFGLYGGSFMRFPL